MNFLIIGSGAIGTYIGGKLAEDGNKVHFFDRPNVVKEIQIHGISLESAYGQIQPKNISTEVDIADALEQASFDFIILAIKSYDTDSFIDQIKPFHAQIPSIICVQNGVENEEKLMDAFGRNKVIPATVTSSIAKYGPGHAVIEKERGIGLTANHPSSFILRNIFQHAGFNIRTYRDPTAMKWSKMLSNLLGNASSAILNLPPIKIFAHPGLFQIEMIQIREAIAVMLAQHLHPVNLPGTPIQALSFIARFFPLTLARILMVQVVGKGRGGKMPSFHIDLYSNSKKSEVDYLNGAVVRYGEKLGVPVPVNRYLTETLRLLINGEIPKESFANNPGKLIKGIEL